jgi:hypothetical protein
VYPPVHEGGWLQLLMIEMTMNRADAEKVHGLVTGMFEQANEVLYVVNNSDDAAFRRKAQLAVGKVIAELGLELLGPIHSEYPDLPLPGGDDEDS